MNHHSFPQGTRPPVMVFDGECGFCRFWVERWRDSTAGKVDYRPFQAVAADYPAIPRESFQEAVQLIEPDGRITSGADAVFRALEFSSGPGRWLGKLLSLLPGAIPLARGVYHYFVARHRTGLSWLTRLLWGRATGKPTYFFAHWLFLRLLGLTFLFAFASLLVQIRGLIGSRGILPAKDYLQFAEGHLGPERYRLLPTVYWFGASDAALVGGCWAGVVLSVIMIAGWWPSLCLIGLWTLYLSLAIVCQTFLTFQWDALLLETALLAVFLAPPFSMRPPLRNQSLSTRLARWLLLWLLFRLMFESGVVKLSSGDPTWRNLTALSYHFETQPLPLPTAWWAHHAPLEVQKGATAMLFAIELGAPFCIFLPRRLRIGGFFALVALQIMIAATGNYAFFNFLAASLCVLMLDDQTWPLPWKRWIGLASPATDGSRDPFRDADPSRPLPPPVALPVSQRGWPSGIVLPIAGLSLLVSAMGLRDCFGTQAVWPGWMQQVADWASPFRSSNRYGLFSVMTTWRYEIVVEGSNDGEHWREYEFRWKPGDVNRMPPIVAPHQPRLDWQMWFAALGTMDQNPWFEGFLVRLLQEAPDVIALLERNPFPDSPPQFIRAVLYEYQFTNPGKGKAWWRREQIGLYCPPARLGNHD